jgi:hypothetical protein
MLPELRPQIDKPALSEEYSSENVTLDHAGLRELLAPYLERPLHARKPDRRAS